jgi:tRNA(Ile)-lysidine synthase
VLLGHTRGDQAETVLLGLGRGSGPRSIAGMPPFDPPWGRPLLAVPRQATAAACAALGLHPWDDPQNADPAFTRVRLRREVLPLLEDVLSGGVGGALARTATALREDAEVLDALAWECYLRARAGEGELATGVLAAEPPAVRRRALRAWLIERGARGLTDAHLRAAERLVTDFHGQKGVSLPGDLVATRSRGRLRLWSGASQPASTDRT